MKRNILSFVVIVFLIVSGLGYDNLHLESFVVNVNGINWDFEEIANSDFLNEIGCCLDTGAVDIVFCMDTTGSMGGQIVGIRSNIAGFTEALVENSIDFRLGAVSFGDGARISDFDPSVPGYQMTDDPEVFIARINRARASGGGDWAESLLDAVADPIRYYNWRSDAMRIIITYTDAPTHEMDWASDESYEGVCDLVLDNNVVVYMCSYSTYYYENLVEISGGEHYPLSTSWDVVFDDVIDMITSYTTIVADVTNVSGIECTITAELTPEDPLCTNVLTAENLSVEDVPPGGSADFVWRIDIDTTCVIPYHCFDINFADGCSSITVSGCITVDSCSFVMDIEEDEILKPELTLTASPNPFNSAVAIHCPVDSPIEILDITGRIVDVLEKNTKTWIPESDIESGTYIIRATDNRELSTQIIYLK